MSVVLDASAVLAYLQTEPGSDSVRSALDESVISAVNWAEVIQKAHAGRVETGGLREDMEALGLKVEPFTVVHAEMAGELWEQTKRLGLSLADRACLALGLDKGKRVYTTDRAWRKLNLGIAIEVIR